MIETVSGNPVRFTVPLDVVDGPWVVLRVFDPAEPNEAPGPAGHPCKDLGVAYTSPWWLKRVLPFRGAERGRGGGGVLIRLGAEHAGTAGSRTGSGSTATHHGGVAYPLAG